MDGTVEEWRIGQDRAKLTDNFGLVNQFTVHQEL